MFGISGPSGKKLIRPDCSVSRIILPFSLAPALAVLTQTQNSASSFTAPKQTLTEVLTEGICELVDFTESYGAPQGRQRRGPQMTRETKVATAMARPLFLTPLPPVPLPRALPSLHPRSKAAFLPSSHASCHSRPRGLFVPCLLPSPHPYSPWQIM